MPRISKRIVDAAKPKKARYFVWDSVVHGFGLVVQPTGTKSYCYQYRTPEGRTHRITVGKHGTYTAETARDTAKDYAEMIRKGRDPLREKRERLRALTVPDLLDRYMESAKFAEKAAETQRNDRSRIERHLKPLLGTKIAGKLTSEDVRKAFAAIKAGKTAKRVKTKPRGLARVTGGEGAARMAIRLLRAAYSWGISEKLIAENPAKGVDIGTDGRRDVIVENADQYRAIFKAIEALQDVQKIRDAAADAIRIIALTGARRGEVAGLRWRHVDLKKGVLTLPVGEHKTSRKTKEPRVIGLPAAAQTIIAAQPEAESDDYVFPPTMGEGPIDLSKPWAMIREKAKLNPQLGLHGLRHSMATHMALAGAEAAQIMAVVGHRNLSTAQKYIHFAQDIRAELAEKAAAGISAALTGVTPADVVKLK